MSDQVKFYTSPEACEYLGISPHYLKKCRARDAAIPLKADHVTGVGNLYSKATLDDWLRRREEHKAMQRTHMNETGEIIVSPVGRTPGPNYRKRDSLKGMSRKRLRTIALRNGFAVPDDIDRVALIDLLALD